MMLDATKSVEQRKLLEIELDAVGIRLNKRKPDIVVKRKTTGGVSENIITVLRLFSHMQPYIDNCVSSHLYLVVLSST